MTTRPSSALDPPHADPPLAFRTQREEVTGAALPVSGDLPDWLAGTFLVDGPGQFEVGGRPLRHWFDALALVRRFRVDGAAGAVRYDSRFVRSRDFRWARRRGRLRTGTVGTPADRGPLGRLRGALAGEFPDNPAIGFQRVAGRPCAVTESPVAHPLGDGDWPAGGGAGGDPDRIDLTAGLDCDLTLGHVHADPERREHVGLGVSYGRDRGYVLLRRPFDATRATAVARLPFDDVPYVHSFALTERYAVVPEFPFGMDATALLAGAAFGRTFLDAFESRPGPTRFHVLDRETGARVATPLAGPTFGYHFVNAFEAREGGARDRGVRGPNGVRTSKGEKGGTSREPRRSAAEARRDEPAASAAGARRAPDDVEIVVDLVAYPDERAITGLTLDGLRAGDPDVPPGDLVRYRLPLVDGAWADRERLHAGPVEFPTVDYRRVNGRPYRHVYLAGIGDGGIPERLVRVDVGGADAGTGGVGAAATWDAAAVAAGDVAYPGEATFVPRPRGAGPRGGSGDADGAGTAPDGVLLSLVLDPVGERSVLVVLDPGDMTERARAPLPQWTPFPFHGQFYAADEPFRTMQ